MDETIQLEEIVYEANRIFLQEQIQYDGDATTCCVSPDKVFSDILGSILRYRLDGPNMGILKWPIHVADSMELAIF